MVTDYRKLRLHSRHDGKLLAASDELEEDPKGMCLISNKEVAVFLIDSTIEILSFEFTHRIERVRRFHVRTGFDLCQSVAKIESTDKLVVTGVIRDDMLYWCVVNLTDGRVDSTHKVCKWGISHLAIKNDTVYISCGSLKPSDTGVYAYHIPDPKRRKFLYLHRDLNSPRGLFVDTRDYIYVCNYYPYSIHQLTERGELVTKHTLSSGPYIIFYEEQDGVMYMTNYGSNKITRYRLGHPHQQGVPEEILNMDEKSIQLFQEALQDGKETVYHIRVMVVGHLGVGKTTLIKRLLGEEVKLSERHSTEGIDVYINCCDASLSTLEWTRRKKNSEQDDRLHRVVRVLNEQQSARGKVADNDQVAILPQGETTDSNACVTDKEQVIIIPQVETTDSKVSVTDEEQVIITQEEITDVNASVTDEEQVIIIPQVETTDSNVSVTDEEQVKITHQEEITDINANVTDIEQVITAHQEETTDINASVTDNERVITAHQEETTDSNPTLTDKERVITAHQEETTDSNQSVTDNEQVITAHQEETTDINASVTDNEHVITAHQEETTDSNPTVTDNEQVITAHQEETTDSNQSVTDNEQVITSHQEETTDINASVTDNEYVITAHQEETTDSNPSVMDNEQVMLPPQGVRAFKSHEWAHYAFENKDTELLYHHSPQQDHALNISATGSQLEELPSAISQRKLTQSEANATPMLHLLQKNADKLKQDTGENAKLTIWDFAGQYAFYTTHQTFLTKRAIYLLVSDVSEQVTDLVADDCYFDSKGIMRCKVHELTEVWLNSIHSCASSSKASTPPVILVGTHVDKIIQKQSSSKLVNLERQSTLPSTSTNAASAMGEEPMTLTFFGSQQESFEPPRKQPRLELTTVASMTGVHAIPSEDQLKKQTISRLLSGREQKIVQTDVIAGPSTVGEIVGADAGKVSHDDICKRYFREIRSYLKDKPTRFHLVDEDFAIDNTVIDKKLESLKRKIVKVASQQSYWGEEIPARWILLEEELMNRKADGVMVISLKEVENINKKGIVQIEKCEELDLFLRYLHETGIIIYFSIDLLRDSIVLDPVWLIDALKSLINAQPNLPESPAENDSQSTIPLDSDADRTATQRWSDFKEKGILRLELVDAVWTQEKHPKLHAHKDHILLIMEQLNIIAKPRSFSEIGEKVENYFLTPCMLRQASPKEVIFPRCDHRMVSTPVLQCVFRGKFMPSPIFHRLLAACVAHWPVAKKKETSENLIFCGCCVFDLDLFHRFTLYFKNHVISARITRMAIDEVKIPDAKLCSRVKRFITLNLSKITSYLGQNLQYDLHVKCPPSQMWLADEVHDPDSPITPEHMNHARLCVALATVCGNALRDILLNQVPAPHTNIYQALLANQANLTTRRQVSSGHWQNALLNQDQIRLVFPGNQGQKTGTVDQFDLSLLYTLIRNVSAVTAPLTGWGNDPQDQPRDTSLGASVERIRSYRNHISGHSPDGKLSQQDLEDYWSKFKAVLDDIETVTGKQVYSPELEKQKRQVISVYEAC